MDKDKLVVSSPGRYFLQVGFAVFFSFISVSDIKAAESLPNFFNLEGFLTDSVDVAIEDNPVVFTIQILNPIEGCVLYEETQSLNMTGSGGRFNLFVGSQVGAGKRTVNDMGISMVEVFSNATTKGTGPLCAGGYIPSPGDQRQIKIEVNSVSLGLEVLPSFSMGSVPSAFVATSIQGLLPIDLIQASGSVTQPIMESLANGSDVSTHNHNTLNDVRYLAAGGAVDQNLGSGQINATGDVGIGFAGVPSANLEIESATPSIHIDDSSGANSSSIDFQSAGVSRGSIDVDSGGSMMLSTNSIPALVVDSAQNISVNQSLNVASGLIVSGHLDITGNGPLRFYDLSDSGFVSISSPATVTSYGLTLPIDAGASGEVLTTDGTGILSWAPPAGSGAVVDVFGRTGNVVAAVSDYDASQVDNTPNGTIAAITVQGAIDELETEKFSAVGGVITGSTLISNTLSVSGNAIFSNAVTIGSTLSTNAGSGVTFNDLDGSNSVVLRPAPVIGANFVLTLPSNSGASGQVLITDGGGVLSWAPPGAAPVASVFGRTGTVVAIPGDYNASQVVSTATSGIASTNVQAAIIELDAEKLPLAGGTMTGALNMNNQNLVSANTITAASYFGTGVMSVGGTLGVGADVTVDTDTFKVDSVNNRVGIGTTTPTEKLDVIGNAKIVGGLGIGALPSTVTPLKVVGPTVDVALFESSSTVSGISFKTANSGVSNRIYISDSNDFYFQTTGGIKMRFFDATNEIQMAGDVDMQSLYTVKNLPDPVAPGDAVNKQTLDSAVQTIAFRATRPTSLGFSGNVEQTIDFNNIEFTVTGGVTTGASWRFTVPAGGAGIYQVNVAIKLTIGHSGTLRLHYGAAGGNITVLDSDDAAMKYERQGSTIVQVNDGDQIYTTYEAAAADTMDVTSPAVNWISIHRVGQ